MACFENAARHLRPGGRFLIETGVPDLQSLPVGQTIIPFHAAPDGISFDVYDVVTQWFSSQHYGSRPTAGSSRSASSSATSGRPSST